MSDSYVVYRIMCLKTSHCYIGQSKNPKIRKSAHFSLLRHGKHYNKYLQNAWNKYGESNFIFEVVESGIPLDGIDARENEWISQLGTYNFNDAIKKPAPTNKLCKWNGIEYGSMKDAAQALGIRQSTMTDRVRKGYTCDDDMPFRSYQLAKHCVWNGIEYPSIVHAAKALGLSQNAMWSRINRGYKTDKEVKPNGKRRAEINHE